MARVKFSALKIYAIKLALYTSGLLYLAIDLFLWHGPLWGILNNKKDEISSTDTASPTVLKIYGEKISAQQRDRRAAELEKMGVDKTALIFKTEQDLINNGLLRIRARYNDKKLPDYLAEAHANLESVLSRAKDENEAEEWLASQGYSRETFAHKLAAVKRQLHYLENIGIKDKTEATDVDISNIEAQMSESLVLPSHRQVSHIFLSTLNKEEEAVKTHAEELLQQLEANPASFADLAKQHSEDARTAHLGGDLGVIYAHYQTPLKEINIFDEKHIKSGVPTLVRSKWGWHIICAGEIQPPRPLTPEEYRESVSTAITSYKTDNEVTTWLQVNKDEAHKKNKIQSYAE